MKILIILVIIGLLQFRFNLSFDYIEEESLFLVFYSAKNKQRKCVKIKL